jgi:hypothetical protein
MKLQDLYQRLTNETGITEGADGSDEPRASQGRKKFLDRAEEIAKLTIPSIEPRGLPLTDVAYSHDGAQAIRGLSSSIRRVLMPPNRTWFKRQLTTKVQQEVERAVAGARGDVEAQLAQINLLIRNEMVQGEKQINAYLHRRKVKARIARAITRNLIEGFNVIRVLTDQINVFPLRLITAYRQHGELKFYILKEEKPIDVRSFGDDSKVVPGSIYTLIDVVNKEVWQSQNDGQAEKVDPMVDGGDWRQYVAFNSEMPDTEHYPDSFGYTFLTLFNEIDALVMDLGEAAANAAWAVLGISPESSLTTTEVTKWRSGQVYKFSPEQLAWLSSATKLTDFGIVNKRLETLQAERRKVFGAGVRERSPGDVTATQILQEVEELDEQTADLLVNYDETLLVPLATAVGVVERIDTIEIPGIGSPIETIVTTGNSALQRQISIMRMLQAMNIIQGLAPDLFNRRATFKLTAEIEGFDEYVDDVLQAEVPPEPIEPTDETSRAEQPAPEVAGSIKQTAGGPQPQVQGEIQRQQNTGRLVSTSVA